MDAKDKIIEKLYGEERPSDWDDEYDPLGNVTIATVKQLMEEYAEKKCIEQKEICQQHFLDTKGYEDIKSAPLATGK